METSSVAQQAVPRALPAQATRSVLAVALVETAYLTLRLAAIAVLAAPIALAAYLLVA
jgi:hypothetical protein